MYKILKHVSRISNKNAMVQELKVDFLDNKRFDVEPAVVTYPKSASQVAKVVQVAAAFQYSVVARSGGVCSSCYD